MQHSDSEIDVGAILASGGSPFPVIEEKVRALKAGERVVFIAPFEPRPLYEHFRAWGAQYEVATTGAGFRIIVSKEENPEEVRVPTFMDLRDLPPPEPMTRTIAAYQQLNAGECLVIHVPHRPIHLLDYLDQNAISWEEQKQDDGSYHIYMIKGPSE